MPGKLRLILAAVLLAALAAPGPAAAQSQPPSGKEESPEELAREGVERLMRALEGILKAIPQYGVPRVEEDGDIVIPRLNPPGEKDGEGTDDGDADTGAVTETRT